MSQEDFDTFYRSTRSDVHLQAFLLTGDLTAATAATKDAYAIAWHHWKKVVAREAKGEHPIEYVRPLAWRLAQRRHTGRIWHRNKGLTDDHKLVLDAVHKLSAAHRRVLILADVAGVELEPATRELALTRVAARRRLDEARAEIGTGLGPAYAERLAALSEPAAAAKLPRTSIVLRAGSERRRVHTVGAVVGAIALTVGAGAAAREPGQERASAVHQVLPGGKPVGAKLPAGIRLTSPDQLLSQQQLDDLTPAQPWTVTRTDTNTRGDGINTICQQTRFADPRGLAALIRTFAAQGKPTRKALQTVEISKDDAAAQRAFATIVQWFAGCQAARLQMMGAYRVTGVGDQASLLQVQVAGNPRATYAVGVARVREITTTLVMMTAGGEAPAPEALASTLGVAVGKLCPSDLGGCVPHPVVSPVPPPPSGEEPGFLATVDLPPVGTIADPWVGAASGNALSGGDIPTRCDRANFAKSGATKARTRTFLIPAAQVSQTFGLTETYGVYSTPRAATAFLAGVRKSVSGCEDRDLTTSVGDERHEAKTPYDVSVWRFTSKVSAHVTVVYRVGFVRVGDTVAKLTFVPSGKDDLDPSTFEALVRRAGNDSGSCRDRTHHPRIGGRPRRGLPAARPP